MSTRLVSPKEFCKGRVQSICTKVSACKWVESKTRSRKSYCRSKPKAENIPLVVAGAPSSGTRHYYLRPEQRTPGSQAINVIFMHPDDLVDYDEEERKSANTDFIYMADKSVQRSSVPPQTQVSRTVVPRILPSPAPQLDLLKQSPSVAATTTDIAAVSAAHSRRMRNAKRMIAIVQLKDTLFYFLTLKVGTNMSSKTVLKEINNKLRDVRFEHEKAVGIVPAEPPALVDTLLAFVDSQWKDVTGGKFQSSYDIFIGVKNEKIEFTSDEKKKLDEMEDSEEKRSLQKIENLKNVVYTNILNNPDNYQTTWLSRLKTVIGTQPKRSMYQDTMTLVDIANKLKVSGSIASLVTLPNIKSVWTAPLDDLKI